MKLTVDSKSPKKVSVSSIDNASRLALGMPIDLNNATENDLLLISGIGEATAQKILDFRNKKVRFQRIEELMEIKGIKEKRLAKLRKYFFLE
jgi:competence protein ComEA